MNLRKTRSKKAEKIKQHKKTRKMSPRDIIDATDDPQSGQSTVAKSLSGEFPPFNDKALWISDPIEKRAYMIGGIQDQRHLPTNDFYCLDITLMKWTNLTDSVRYRDIESPFSAENCTCEFRRIPKLSLPGYTLFRLYQTSFLLLFGGYDVDSEQTSSRLIVIDLRRLEWWYQPVQSGIVVGRIHPTVAAVDRKLYIFGGYRHFSGDGNPHSSYSIAALSDDGKDWSWEARDISYPKNVPQGTIFAKATAIYNGEKILLSPGRTTKHVRINFEEDNIFCFHIARRKFQLVDVSGDFPKRLGWYFNFAMPVSSVSPPMEASNSLPGPSHSTPLSRFPLNPFASYSVVICGWMDWADSLIPEVWHLELTPVECIRKLDLIPIVESLDSELDTESDLRTAVMMGDRLFLLGSRKDTHKDDRLVFNVYFEVPLRRLCAHN